MKFVIIGAGSGFGSRLSIDILSREPLQDTTIALCDTDEEKLNRVASFVRRAIEVHKLPADVLASADRRELLSGADFVVTAVSIGGAAYYGFPYKHEVEIPRKYGVDQVIADTLGPGGVFRALRTGPVMLEMCRDMEELCPNAIVINYTNPMSMLTWAMLVGSSMRVVGLCHSVQGTSKQLAKYIGVPYEEVGFWVAGINHMSWFLKFEHKGKDAYPMLREAMEKPEIYEQDRVRFEMMRHFGYFVTESTRHNSEYSPYFRRTPELMDEYKLESRQVSMEMPKARQEWLEDMGVKASGKKDIGLRRSHEYASGITEAFATNQPFRFNGNVINHGLVTNLPSGCCVEVPCMTDNEGVHPCYVGELPPQCAALNRANVAVQELTVNAILNHDRESAYHALILDPLTAATVSLKNARKMFDEMWDAEGDLLGAYD